MITDLAIRLAVPPEFEGGGPQISRIIADKFL
jgi:hypothetical protein